MCVLCVLWMGRKNEMNIYIYYINFDLRDNYYPGLFSLIFFDVDSFLTLSVKSIFEKKSIPSPLECC